jgi:hypothetical protein
MRDVVVKLRFVRCVTCRSANISCCLMRVRRGSESFGLTRGARGSEVGLVFVEEAGAWILWREVRYSNSQTKEKSIVVCGFLRKWNGLVNLCLHCSDSVGSMDRYHQCFKSTLCRINNYSFPHIYYIVFFSSCEREGGLWSNVFDIWSDSIFNSPSSRLCLQDSS